MTESDRNSREEWVCHWFKEEREKKQGMRLKKGIW